MYDLREKNLSLCSKKENPNLPNYPHNVEMSQKIYLS